MAYDSKNPRRHLVTQRFLLSASSIAAIAAGSLLLSPANAQDADEANAESDTIVVTARKREESLKDVPLSVQAYSAEALEKDRIDNVENLVGRTPNLSLSSNLLSPGNDFLNIVVRGVGAQSAGAPAVGTFVDGAFVPSLSFDIGFLDVERVEVLRGPQGTLFGRNTQGGALNIVVRRPDEDFRAKAAFTYDEFNTARAQGSISGPITDKLFGGLSADISRTDGYLRNPVVADVNGARGTSASVPANDQSRFSGRLALRYLASDNLEINLTADGSYRTGLDGHPGVPRGVEDYIVRSEFQIDGEYENYGAALNIDYALGGVDITAISAYRYVSTFLPFDFDGSPERSPNFQDIQSHQEFYSQELRFAGEFGDQLQWLVGAYGFLEDQVSDRSIQFSDIDLFGLDLLVDAQTQTLDRSGYAVFGDLIWQPTDWLELSGGVRYADETVDSAADLDFGLFSMGVPLPAFAVLAQPTGSTSDSNVSPTGSVRVKLTDDVSAYARYAQGFRAGGFPLAPASPISNVAFNSETSENYELGLKGSILDGSVDFDLSVFQVDISDQQVTTLVFFEGNPDLPIASVANAAESRTRGFEASINARPTEYFEFNSSFGHVDAEYREYVDTVGADRSGERFPFTPKWTAQIGGTATVPLSDFGELDLSLQYRYVGDILSGSGVDIDLQFPVESYDIIDLNASLRRNNWRFDVFVDNLTNDFVETRVFNAFFFSAPRPFSVVLPPRRIGARFTIDFD